MDESDGTKDNVKVVLRVRPMNSRENSNDPSLCINNTYL